jgi:osmoprotectant transport system substrate-binding protein
LKLSIVTLVVLTACGDSGSTDTTVALKAKITISSTTDPVSKLIAEIYGQSLEKAAFRVARKSAFDTSGELLTAMSKGEVQLTGVSSRSLLALLNKGEAPAEANTTAAQAAAIAQGLPPNVKMAAPTSAEDKDVVYCASAFTDANTIVTLTDLGAKPGVATLAAPEGFDTATPLGGAALKDLYGIEFKAVVPTEVASTLAAIQAGTADCGIGSSGDPALSDTTVTVLQDDKTLVPNDVILPLITTDAGTDDVLATIDAVSARLTPESFRALMTRMAADGSSPESVANEFVGNAGT